MVQDFLSTPPLREILTSKDNKAWLLPVGVPGEFGSTQSYFAATEIAKMVKETVAGTTLTVNVTGPAATIVDMIDIGEKDRTQHRDRDGGDAAGDPARSSIATRSP